MTEVARLELRLADVSTPMWVGSGALDEAIGSLGGALEGRRVFTVTAPPIRRLYGSALEKLEAVAGEYSCFEVADGEAAKTAESAQGLWRSLLRQGGKRDSVVVALGGGSVGDLAGFVAATFLRGIDFVQVPTTLLAQVDAAIGGKTGINLPEAKNSVGAFHHPVALIADTIFLETISNRQLRSGLFEVVKTAAMLDADLFAVLEAELDALLGRDLDALSPVVQATAAAKIRVVEQDPRERNLRRLLNFGHTLGHALESSAAALENGASLLHGEAVGYGMLFAVQVARGRGLDEASARRIDSLVRRVGLPELPRGLGSTAVRARIGRDKKAREGGLAWVLPASPGVGEIVDDLDAGSIGRELDRFLSAHGVAVSQNG